MASLDFKLNIERTLAPLSFPDHLHTYNAHATRRMGKMETRSLVAENTYHSSMLTLVPLITV